MSYKDSLKNLANTEDSDDEEDQDYIPEESDDENSDIKSIKRKLSDESSDQSPTKSKKDQFEPIKEEDKKKADELWENFLKDVKSKPAKDADYAKKYENTIDTKKETPKNKPKVDFFSSYETKDDATVHKIEKTQSTSDNIDHKDEKRKKPMGMTAILDKINNNEKLSTLVIKLDVKKNF